MSKFVTRQDAIKATIIKPINECDNVANYNIEAIADAVLSDYADGYRLMVDEYEFWNILADNVL